MDVLGREVECRAIRELLDAARRGTSGVVVLRADAGMGKTCLLEHAVSLADGMDVVRVDGVEAESEFAYAALHRLVRSHLHRLSSLPDPQRAALESAFGIRRLDPPDRFMVGLATLTMISETARDTPMLCVVDDAHWVDRESLEAIALAARRLAAESVVLLFAARDLPGTGPTLDGLPDLRIPPLDHTHAAALARRTLAAPLDEVTTRRLVTETAGNPLAIIELALSLTPEELMVRGHTPDPLPLGQRLERHFLQQIRDLPRSTQQLLLIASAEPSQDAARILAAARQHELGATDAAAAAARGLFSLTSRPLFRHPLIRSAVYGGASPGERRDAHAALAAVTAPDDGDQRAWHLAAAAAGPSEDVAVELARGAERARARGGYSAAGVYLARAAELTPDPGRRADRALEAATNHLAGGSVTRARSLLDAVDLAPTDVERQTAALRLRGAIAFAAGDMPTAIQQLLRAADRLADRDLGLARRSLLQAAVAARFAGPWHPDGGSHRDIALAASRLVSPPGAAASIPDMLLDSYTALHLDGHAAAAPVTQRALAALRSAELNDREALQWLGVGCWFAGATGDDEAMQALSTRLVDAARDQGALVELAGGLLYLAMSTLLRGSLGGARACFDERAELMSALGVEHDLGQLVVTAWSGPEHVARAELARVSEFATERRQGWMLPFVEYARAILELGLGRYDALIPSGPVRFTDDAYLGIVGFPNLVEALVRTNRTEQAAEAFSAFGERATVNATSLSLGLRARTKALVAPDDEADDLFAEAIARLTQAHAELQLGRARLLYGEWLRRQRRRTEAREQLRAAHDLFIAREVGPFAERARIELEATGARAQSRSAPLIGQLTPRERQVAILASEGETNAEIATKLFLSASTVDYHLRKVYQKLGIDTRRQLRHVLVDT